MNSPLIVLVLCFVTFVQADEQALKQCESVHHVNIHTLPNVGASYSNQQCTLSCFVGTETIASDGINEGLPCPLDSTGVCQKGKCIGGKNGAFEECGKLHKLDFQQLKSDGTEYSNGQCTLKCVLDGKSVSTNALNEGLQCPANSNGVCRNGECISGTGPTSGPLTPTQPSVTVPSTPSSFQKVDLAIGYSHLLPGKADIKYKIEVCWNAAGKSFSWNTKCDLSCSSELLESDSPNEIKCLTVPSDKLNSDNMLAIRFVDAQSKAIGEYKQSAMNTFHSLVSAHLIGEHKQVTEFASNYLIHDSTDVNVGWVNLDFKITF